MAGPILQGVVTLLLAQTSPDVITVWNIVREVGASAVLFFAVLAFVKRWIHVHGELVEEQKRTDRERIEREYWQEMALRVLGVSEKVAAATRDLTTSETRKIAEDAARAAADEALRRARIR